MAGGTQIPIAACREGSVLLVRPSGGCTVAICGGLKECLGSLHKPDTSDIYLDLSQTANLDSTFIGLLLSLATRKNDPAAPEVHLVSPSEAAIEALSRMHVLSLFDVREEPPPLTTTWTMLALERAGAERTADVVVEAHEKLIEADPRNVAPFKPVVEGFRAARRKSDE